MKTSDEKIYVQSINDLRTPDAPDLRLYRLIPYAGKLNKLTDDIKLPFTTISVTSATKSKKIQLVISYDIRQRCAYINESNYKKYQSQVDAWFLTSTVPSISRSETDNVGNSSLETEENDRNTKVTEKSIVNPSNNGQTLDTDASEELKGEGLKAYLLSDFGDHNYKRKSIVEIFFIDGGHFNSLKKSGKIRKEALMFFEKNGALIKEAESIPTDGFRRLRFEGIVTSYVHKEVAETPVKKEVQIKSMSVDQKSSGTDKSESLQSVQKPVSSEPTKAQTKVDKTSKGVTRPLHCIRDNSVLALIDQKMVKIGKNKAEPVVFPRYYCPKCMRLYTSIPKYLDSTKIRFQDKRYTNIHPENERLRYAQFLRNPHPLEMGSKCFVYARKADKPTQCRNCGDKGLVIRGVSRNKGNPYKTLFCPTCHAYYLQYKVYKAEMQSWTLLNLSEVPAVKLEYEKEIAEKERRKAEKAAERKLLQEQRKERQRQRKQEQQRLKEEVAEKQRRARELREQRLQNEKKAPIRPISFPKGTEPRKHGDNKIRVEDFVVRRTTFKCMHEGHALQNVDGIIEIINDKGDVVQARVPAGYCSNCNVFFIMESTYQRLKMKGTPICRISDEKTYLKTNISANGMRLAQESVLMQYGYTVSQQEGLSSSRRAKILAVLIDNDILTRTEIISYLDFFINQRKFQHKYEKAIEKWEIDREFVSEYKTGAYSQYGISGISRKY